MRGSQEVIGSIEKLQNVLRPLREEERTALQNMNAEQQILYILQNLSLDERGRVTVEHSTKTYTKDIDIQKLGLSDQDTSTLSDQVSQIQRYLANPYLFDGFGEDHNARRSWRSTLSAVFGTDFSRVYQQNKLKWGQIAGIESYLSFSDMIATDYQNLQWLSEAASTALDAIAELLPDEESYGQLSNEEKQARIEAVCDVLVEYLDTIASHVS